MPNCLVTGGSKNDTAPIAVLLLNIAKTQHWVDHVIVYHDGIPEKQQKLMQSIRPVEFIRYQFPGSKRNFNEIVKYVYTEMVFCKYECLKLLKRFDYVVWTDYDVVFQREVTELLDFEDDSSGWKSLVSNGEKYQSFGEQIKSYAREELSAYCPLDKPTLSTGLMVLSKSKLKQPEKIYEKCISFTEKFGGLLVLPEQAILDMVLHQENVVPEAISWKYATLPTGNPSDTEAPILHTYSQPKFWNGRKNRDWEENYAEWLRMGGVKWRPASKFSWKEIGKRLMFLKGRMLNRRK